MRKCYSFIKKNIKLCADVNEKTGKQTLYMQKLNDAGDIILEETLDCIHTVVVNTKLDVIQNEDFENKTLDIISSEDLEEFELSIDEKFKAFNSWVAGIAEADLDALRIQGEIEAEAKLIFPVIQPILKFLALADIDILLEYLTYLERVCKFEGVRHDSSLISNLNPIIDLVINNKKKEWDENMKNKILRAIFQINPPFELFSQSYKRIELLKHPDASEIEDFNKGFTHSNKFIRRKIAENPKAIHFDKYKLFLNIKNEKDYRVRRICAANPLATKFKEYKNFLSFMTEPNYKVRLLAAKNQNAGNFKEFSNFYNIKTEPNERIRKIVAMRDDVENFNAFKNFFSIKTEPSSIVRKNTARNPLSPNYIEFKKFLNANLEPNYEVRISAILNPDFNDKEILNEIIDGNSEPLEIVRKIIKNKLDSLKEIDKSPKVVSKYDYDYYDYLIEELNDLQQEFDIDNQELIKEIRDLADILFPKNLEVREDISRELKRLKRILVEKMPKKRFFSNQ